MRALKRWRLGFIVAFAASLLALYPQFNLWYLTGNNWSGIYAYNDIDEVAYAAYLSALIEGRPRLNDPYTGRDQKVDAPQPESLFSIQFLPPLMVAQVARLVGLSISWAMIALSALAAFLAALVLFWLIRSLTDDEALGAAGALAIICLGTLACAQGAILELTGRGIAYPYLPFLRRYVPLFPFPLFFLMCGLVWKSITSRDASRSLWTAAGAGLVFASLVYSYFYIWTTALAWLVLLVIVLLLTKPEGYKSRLMLLGLTGSIAVASLLPYAWLLSHRARTMDDIQLLVESRAPDLARTPELISLFVLALLMLMVKRGRIELRAPSTLFTISLALVPYAVFNQQVITGRSLQPIHYEVFIANYISVLAVVLSVGLIRRGARIAGKPLFPGWAVACACVLIFGWGLFEAKVTTEVINPHNEHRNRVTPVILKLAEMARAPHDGRSATEQLVYSPDGILDDELPTLAPQPVLWARHQHIFVGADAPESKERFYQWMYYTGYNAEWLENALEDNNFAVVYALFGWGRLSDRLVVNPQPLTQEEIDKEVQSYGDYMASFDRERARRFTLSYLIMPVDDLVVRQQVERWYEHDEGTRVGDFMLFRLKLKP